MLMILKYFFVITFLFIKLTMLIAPDVKPPRQCVSLSLWGDGLSIMSRPYYDNFLRYTCIRLAGKFNIRSEKTINRVIEIIHAIILTESYGDKTCIEYKNGRAISFGLMQVSLCLCRQYRIFNKIDSWAGTPRQWALNWENNIEVGVWNFYRNLKAHGGDVYMALTAHNIGRKGATDRGRPYYTYVRRVLRFGKIPKKIKL